MKKLNCSANAKVHTSVHNTMIMFSMPCAKPSGIGIPTTNPSPPSFQNTGHCPKAKAPTEPGRKRKRKEDMLQKYIKKQREMEREKRDLFTLKYEYFHFFSIKKRPVYTQIQSSIHFQKTAVFVFIIYRNRAFSFLLHLILFPVKITRFYFQHGFPQKWQMLTLCSRNTSLALLWTAQEFSAETTQNAIQKQTLQQWAVTRLTCAIKNPELGGFQSGEQMNHKTCLKIFNFF